MQNHIILGIFRLHLYGYRRYNAPFEDDLAKTAASVIMYLTLLLGDENAENENQVRREEAFSRDCQW